MKHITLRVYLAIITALISIATSQSEEGKKEHVITEVLVIGGGIAGLAAARKLTNQPSQKYSVTVLEAQKDRYGGRVWTSRKFFKKPKGAETDLGAMWINTKEKDNPISELIRKGEVETKVIGPIQLHVPEKGKVFRGDNANKIFSEVFSIMQSAVDNVRYTGKDISLDKAVEEEIARHDFQGDKDIITNILRSHHAVTKGDYSTVLFDPVKQFGWNTVAVDGYDQILDVIVAGVGSEMPLSIDLNQVVRQIQVKPDKGKVIVRTKDLKQITADAVIVAVPIGVLRNEAILFDPPLPKEWYKAMKDLGIGHSNKVIVGFSEAFWPEDVGVFTMTAEEDTGFLQTWVNMYNLVGEPYLIGSIYGDAAKAMEKMSVDEIKHKALQVLSKLFGEDLVAQHNVTTLVRSQWESDPFTLGAGGYPRTGNSKSTWDAVSSPVCPYIYFAGEHTSVDGMIGASGAYNTGVRAADQIITGRCERELKRKQAKKEKETEEKKNDEDGKKKDEL